MSLGSRGTSSPNSRSSIPQIRAETGLDRGQDQGGQSLEYECPPADDSSQFLSTLDRIDPLNPLPPSVSPTTAAELQEWWDEHDKIESEVEAYDMGDLNKLKGFAKSRLGDLVWPLSQFLTISHRNRGLEGAAIVSRRRSNRDCPHNAARS